MKKPNFYILGAPKCGTTTLTHWLRAHPEVFFSPIKEPFYFSDDLCLNQIHKIDTLEAYERLFRGARSFHAAVGEGSTAYLFSTTAVDNILDYTPGARFIVMMRNPVDMAVSLHSQQLYLWNESVKDFMTAWNLQSERKAGMAVPPACMEPKVLLYKEWCCLGIQLERLFEKVKRQNVKVIFLEDLKFQPEMTYDSVLDFLRLSRIYPKNFAAYNVRKEITRPLIHKFLRAGGSLKKRIVPRLRMGLTRLSTRRVKPEPVPEAVRQYLIGEFYSDVKRLETVLGKDLSHWLS